MLLGYILSTFLWPGEGGGENEVVPACGRHLLLSVWGGGEGACAMTFILDSVLCSVSFIAPTKARGEVVFSCLSRRPGGGWKI